jgi:hypothetical protein
MHAGLVRADHHPSAADLLELPHGGLRLGREPQQPQRMLAEEAPASVSAPLREDRSNSRSPSSSSSRRTAWLTAGWVRCSFLAAFEKLRSSATARKALRSWSCTPECIIMLI